ncbi:MAG: hypothetical protein AAGH64_08755 [Planctomycetota bacterium]
MSRARTRGGFTLPELIVGGVVVALIASSVVLSLSQAIDSEQRSRSRQEATRRANALADRIAQDMRSIARESELFYTRVLLAPGSVSGDTASELLLVAEATGSRPPATTGEGRTPTGATREVQYRVVRDDRREGVPGGDDEAHIAWRRIDDLPDEFVDAGGVVYPVATGIRSVLVQAHDGEGWTDEWDSDVLGYPHALRVEVRATSDSGEHTPRAVRVVAIDRVPLPVEQQFPTELTGGE